jgi:hypothetical protein
MFQNPCRRAETSPPSCIGAIEPIFAFALRLFHSRCCCRDQAVDRLGSRHSPNLIGRRVCCWPYRIIVLLLLSANQTKALSGKGPKAAGQGQAPTPICVRAVSVNGPNPPRSRRRP